MGNCASDVAGLVEDFYFPNPHIPDPHFAFPLSQIPDYTNAATRAALQTLDPFVYDNDDPEDIDLPQLGPYKLIRGEYPSAVYIGQWKNGKMQGKGKILFPNGLQIEGYWKKGMLNGKVRFILIEGVVGECEWFDKETAHERVFELGNPEGYYHSISRKERLYIKDISYGNKVERKITGKDCSGSCEFYDGRKYNGEFKNPSERALGVMTWADGRRYEGEFFEGKMNGYGVYEWPDGKKYKGHWKDDQQHGRGVCVDCNGFERVGEWNEGKRIRWIEEKENLKKD